MYNLEKKNKINTFVPTGQLKNQNMSTPCPFSRLLLATPLPTPGLSPPLDTGVTLPLLFFPSPHTRFTLNSW